MWKSCCQVFDYLNIAAIIDGRVLCVHGGLSPELRSLDQIRTIMRLQEVPHEGPFCDLMWSDPEEIETWSVSPRGAGWLFGRMVTKDFNHLNGLELIARAHQLVQEGFKLMHDKNIVTVWSAPNYCYRCGNVASVFQVDDLLEIDSSEKPTKRTPVLGLRTLRSLMRCRTRSACCRPATQHRSTFCDVAVFVLSVLTEPTALNRHAS